MTSGATALAANAELLTENNPNKTFDRGYVVLP
jgi:hypothetical protein